MESKKMALIYKSEILKYVCYTELVYGRINKKLQTNLLKSEVEEMVYKIISVTNERHFKRIGKNIYVTSSDHQIKITINSNTFRIITVDRI